GLGLLVPGSAGGRAGGLLPRLDADIEVGELGPQRTQLSIIRYTPPFGSLGRVLDRALLHLAEAAVKDFLDRAGQGLAAAPRRPAGK
ncbi:MAG TPA: hypothetical protein VNA32_05770, partial [Actinomycetota bacterium]|nr:hypothetical protein [Actinomycetota bacterium]